ncbi:hypothetical protein [Streptomyces sp. TE33382]
MDDPEHPSTRPYYRPERLSAPAIDARNLYYRRQWHTAPPLPPLSSSPEPTADGPQTELGDPAHQLLAHAAADRAADLLSQALRLRRNPLVDPVRRLTPEQDAARLAAYQSSGSSQPLGYLSAPTMVLAGAGDVVRPALRRLYARCPVGTVGVAAALGRSTTFMQRR